MATKGETYNLIALNDIIPEADDNETKYKWNGALKNISDMNPTEYATTIFIVSGITSQTLVSDEITIALVKTGSTYDITATATYAPKSALSIQVEIGDTIYPLSLGVGAMSASTTTTIPSTQEEPFVKSCVITPSNDTTYSYIPKLPTRDSFTGYLGVYLQKDITGITVEEIASMTMVNVPVTGDGVTLTYGIPQRDKQTPTQEELENYRWCLLFAIPRYVFDTNRYKITDSVFGKSTGFTYQGSFTLNGAEYVLLANHCENTEFIGRYSGIINYNYNVKYLAN